MEDLIPTPVDHLTGLPLPIAPDGRVLPTNNPEIADWHHHFHPRLSPKLKTVGGQAIRCSRLQLVRKDTHNTGPNSYHEYFSGPAIPDSEQDQFKMAVLMCAGYLPKEGISIIHGEPMIKRLNERETELLRNLKDSNYRNFRHDIELVKTFFRHYALSQDLSFLSENLIEEFLKSKNLERRRYLGHFILAKAIESATDTVRPVYAQAYKGGLLLPETPGSPVDLVRSKLGHTRQREGLFAQLGKALQLQLQT